MDRETVIQNIKKKYGKYGVTEDMLKEEIEPLISDSEKEGLTYDLIYLTLKAEFPNLLVRNFIVHLQTWQEHLEYRKIK